MFKRAAIKFFQHTHLPMATFLIQLLGKDGCFVQSSFSHPQILIEKSSSIITFPALAAFR